MNRSTQLDRKGATATLTRRESIMTPARREDSPTQQEYQNKMEQWYGSCPGPVQTVLNFGNAFQTVNTWLKKVAGDPEKIISYGPKYVALGDDLKDISQDVTQTAGSIRNWSGDSYTNFMAKTKDFADKVEKAGEAVAGTQEILVACAKGCVEVANCICDLVMMFVKFMVKSYLAALASSSISFGATVAAWLGANIAKGIQMVQQVTSAISKLSELIQKVVSLIQQVMEVVRKIQQVIQLIKGIFAAFRAFRDGDFVGGVQALAGVAQGASGLTGGAGGLSGLTGGSGSGGLSGVAQQVSGLAGGLSGLAQGISGLTGGSSSNGLSGLAESTSGHSSEPTSGTTGSESGGSATRSGAGHAGGAGRSGGADAGSGAGRSGGADAGSGAGHAGGTGRSGGSTSGTNGVTGTGEDHSGGSVTGSGQGRSWGQLAGAAYDRVAGADPEAKAGETSTQGGIAGMSKHQIVREGITNVANDAQGAWGAIKDARAAAKKNAPPTI